MHSLYILFSNKIDRYYVGESENPSIRLNLHNEHHFKNGFTNAASDWEIVFDYKCNSKADALFLERFIKRMKSRKFIVKFIEDKDILTNILRNKK